jgi:hypothetical protein
VNPPNGRTITQKEALTELWNRSDRQHELVGAASMADLCMVCDLSGPDWFAGLRNHPDINKNPGKCFAVHDGDIAMPLLHGIYTSAIKAMGRFRRVRGGAYNLFPKETRNPRIEECDGRGYLHAKKYLVSFRGQNSSRLRKSLFALPKHPDIEILDTTGEFSAFRDLPGEKTRFQEAYYTSLVSAKFGLCPRGVSPSSIRLFETMKAGVAPIIVSDACLLPAGPNWEEFALIVKENDIESLPRIAGEFEHASLEMGRKARMAYESFFQDSVYFNYLVNQMTEIRKAQRIPERIFWALRNYQVRVYEKKQIPLKNWND